MEFDRSQAQARISALRELLRENARKYYVENAPTMSDFEYDQRMHELEELEAAWPEFQSPDSPTRRVGSDLEDGGFAKFPHKYPMLSLGNTYSMEEVEAGKMEYSCIMMEDLKEFVQKLINFD